MSPRFSRGCLFACSTVIAAACGSTPSTRGEPMPAVAPELRVEGFGDVPIVFRAGELDALGPEDITWAQHGITDIYRGVSLDRVVVRAGLDAGQGGPGVAPQNRLLGLRRVVVATDAEGFTAVFSSAELLPELGATHAYLAWRKNGQPLPLNEAPLRLLVTTEQRETRSLRSVVGLRVEEPRLGTPR